MKQNSTFQMTYSAQQQQELTALRKKYMPKEEDRMQRLRALDAAVSRKATQAALLPGILGALILGCGMSLVMTDFGAALAGAALPVGIAVGAGGIALLALAYPAYTRTLQKEREKAAPEILRLTDELLK